MTIQELNTRQGWTLNQKIDHAVGTVEAFLSRTGKVPTFPFPAVRILPYCLTSYGGLSIGI